MKKYLLLVAAVFFFSSSFAQPAKEQASFNFTSINVGQVIQLIYSEVITSNYTLDPEVLSDQRLVSFRYKPEDGPLKPFIAAFLDSLGYSVERRSGVDFIAKTKVAEKIREDEQVFVYNPRFRDAGYISRVLSPLFKGRFTGNRSVQAAPGAGVARDVPAESAAGQIQQDMDVLVFAGVAAEVAHLVKLLPQIDTAKGEVSVKAVVYEVSRTKQEGSAFQLLADVLGGKLGISINSDAAGLSNALSINFKGISAIIGALSGDARFNVITEPRLRVRSGEASKLVVGQEVPVVGNVTYQQGGNAVRSIDYRSAGTILMLTPTVRADSIDVRIEQQLSNFVTTTTGVNDSPTLIKREIQTAITMKSGEVIVLGGLTETKKTKAEKGVSFLPWALSKTDDEATVDVLIVLQLERV